MYEGHDIEQQCWWVSWSLVQDGWVVGGRIAILWHQLTWIHNNYRCLNIDHGIIMSTNDYEPPPYCANMIGNGQLPCKFKNIKENYWVFNQSTNVSSCEVAF